VGRGGTTARAGGCAPASSQESERHGHAAEIRLGNQAWAFTCWEQPTLAMLERELQGVPPGWRVVLGMLVIGSSAERVGEPRTVEFALGHVQ